jgi:IS605 OrfB family transposase
MSQTISVSCQLQVPPELRQEIDATLEEFANACNGILEVAKREKCFNTTKLHHKVYKPLREATGLKANHVAQAIRRVVTACKTHKQVRKFRPNSMSLDARTFAYIEPKEQVSVALKNKRVKFPLSIGNYQRALLKGRKPTSATLKKTRQGDYYINISIELETPPTGKTPKVLGVDLGRRDIATTSSGQSWQGKQLQETRAKFVRVRASIQAKGTKGAKRLLKRLSGRESRFQRHINHNISKQLVKEAKETKAAIALEDLSGIRQRAKIRKSQNRAHHNWSFHQLKMFTEYKAAIAGVEIFLVNPAYTSKTCNCCKVIGNRHRKRFNCLNLKCGWVGDADHNGALNISKLGVAVNQPELSTMFCSLQDIVREKASTKSTI